MDFKNKYQLTKEQNIFLAKKKWDENIYCGMAMEHRAVTFPQTQTILAGVNVPDVQLDDIQAILNMRDAWRYLLQTVDQPITLDYFCQLNAFISRNESLAWGTLRTGSVGISGTDYLPPIPEAGEVDSALSQLLQSGLSETEKALELFAWGTRGQFFWDGNKRTSMTLANKLLVSSGCGILTITDKHMERFNDTLLDFYNTGDSSRLKEFLYENAIQGMQL